MANARRLYEHTIGGNYDLSLELWSTLTKVFREHGSVSRSLGLYSVVVIFLPVLSCVLLAKPLYSSQAADQFGYMFVCSRGCLVRLSDVFMDAQRQLGGILLSLRESRLGRMREWPLYPVAQVPS